MKMQTVFKGVILSTILFMSGCASKTVYQEQTGFLDRYDSLTTKNSSKDKFVHIYSLEDLSAFKKVRVKSVHVISGISQDEQTDAQKKLYKTISEYLSKGLKKAINEDPRLKLVDLSDEESLDLEFALSAVEVHFNDAQWNQFSRTDLGVNVVSYGVYLDEAVRLLVETRISAKENLQAESMEILKDHVIRIEESHLSFADVKPALDAWLEGSVKSLNEIRKISLK